MTRSKKTAAAVILTSILSTTTASPAETKTGAILTEKDTTVTALEVPNTTGLAVVDGTTYSFRGSGLTLPNGDVVSVLFDGIGDKKTTDTYGLLVTQQVPNPTVHNPLTVVPASGISGGATASQSLSGVSVTIPDTTASSGAVSNPSAASASASASASSSVESSNMGTPQSIGGGKVVALVGALAAVVLCGL